MCLRAMALCIRYVAAGGFPKERVAVKREEKKEEKDAPIPWEAVDPKPPVIRSGHLENQIRN